MNKLMNSKNQKFITFAKNFKHSFYNTLCQRNKGPSKIQYHLPEPVFIQASLLPSLLIRPLKITDIRRDGKTQYNNAYQPNS